MSRAPQNHSCSTSHRVLQSFPSSAKQKCFDSTSLSTASGGRPATRQEAQVIEGYRIHHPSSPKSGVSRVFYSPLSITRTLDASSSMSLFSVILCPIDLILDKLLHLVVLQLLSKFEKNRIRRLEATAVGLSPIENTRNLQWIKFKSFVSVAIRYLAF